MGGEGEVDFKKLIDLEVIFVFLSCCGDLNKNIFCVGLVEESEDELFVFGW